MNLQLAVKRTFATGSILCSLLFAPRAQAQTAPLPSETAGFAEVNGGRLYYEVAGAGHPLVLIHGGQMDRRLWDGQFRLLAKQYRVIRYDVRGYGKSPAATAPYASEEDLYALLKYLKVEKAHLVGLSLGGRIIIDFALTHPEMVGALIPVAPGLSGFPSSPDANDWNILEAAQAADWVKAAEFWLKSGFMAPAMENPAIAPRLRELSIENAHENLDNPLLERRLKPTAMERLPQIHAPTLIIVGDRDVTDIHQITGLLLARIPGAKEVVIAGSGHIVNMERPEEFDRAVLDFLAPLGSH